MKQQAVMLTLVVLGAGLIAIPITVTEVDAVNKDETYDYCGISEDGDQKLCTDTKKECKDFTKEKGGEKCEIVEEGSSEGGDGDGGDGDGGG